MRPGVSETLSEAPRLLGDQRPKPNLGVAESILLIGPDTSAVLLGGD